MTIGGLAFHSHVGESLYLFRKIQKTNVCPNKVSHVSNIDEG